MRVPREVDVQRRDAEGVGVLRHDEHEAAVFLEEAVHDAALVGAVEPVDLKKMVSK